MTFTVQRQNCNHQNCTQRRHRGRKNHGWRSCWLRSSITNYQFTRNSYRMHEQSILVSTLKFQNVSSSKKTEQQKRVSRPVVWQCFACRHVICGSGIFGWKNNCPTAVFTGSRNRVRMTRDYHRTWSWKANVSRGTNQSRCDGCTLRAVANGRLSGSPTGSLE